MSSITAYIGAQWQAVYTATKAAVHSVVSSAAQDADVPAATVTEARLLHVTGITPALSRRSPTSRQGWRCGRWTRWGR